MLSIPFSTIGKHIVFVCCHVGSELEKAISHSFTLWKEEKAVAIWAGLADLGCVRGCEEDRREECLCVGEGRLDCILVRQACRRLENRYDIKLKVLR